MTVDIIRVAVCGYQHLHSWPRTDGELFRHLMRLLGRDVFPISKGLHILIEVGAIQFPVRSLCGFELQNRIGSVAVDTTDEIPL